MDAITETQPAAAPVVKGGVIAYLQVNGATKAADFYTSAFGARTEFAYPPDENGRTMHIHLHINGSSVMLGDPCPVSVKKAEQPQGFSLLLQVDNIDAWWQRAVEAGAEVVMPVSVMFWGDRYGQLRDPFGILWALNEPKHRPGR
jgi:uncharacterized glyoxalase superfamily protein PhnB